LLIRFDAKQANKAILFASKRINIRFKFAYIRFEPNMSGAPYSEGFARVVGGDKNRSMGKIKNPSKLI
jgi:hypothetical protein